MKNLRLLIFLSLFALAANSPAPAADQIAARVAVLHSNASQKEKADACRELARIGTKDAVAQLVALLPDEQLSHMARYALETIPDPSVDKAFRSALSTLHGRPLVGVIGSISFRRDPKAVKPLAKLLRAPDAEVVQAAARALGSIGNSEAASALLADLDRASAADRLAFCEGLFRCAERFSAGGQRQKALRVYDRLREAEVPHQVRTAALRGAILNRGEAGLPLLLQALRNDDFGRFAAAVRISQEMPGPAVTRALANELGKGSIPKQVLLVQTLGRRADNAVTSALLDAIKKCDLPVGVAAVQALPQTADASSVPVLVELMRNPNPELAQAAQDSLAALPNREADAAVTSMLSSAEPDRRATAMQLVIRRRMSSALPELYRAAVDPQMKMCVEAIKALGELAPASDLPRLLDLLNHAKDPEQIDAAEQALSSVSARAADPDLCAETLGKGLAVAQPPQKIALVHVLTATGGQKALASVHHAVSDSNSDVRGNAIRALGAWNTPDAAPYLLDLARTSAETTDKKLCIRNYLRFCSQSDLPAEQRLAMCREVAPLVQEADEKKLWLAALGGVPLVGSIELLRPSLDDPATSQEACAACLNIAEKLLQGSAAQNVPNDLLDALQKAAQVTANPDLATKAKSLLAQAQTRTAAK